MRRDGSINETNARMVMSLTGLNQGTTEGEATQFNIWIRFMIRFALREQYRK